MPWLTSGRVVAGREEAGGDRSGQFPGDCVARSRHRASRPAAIPSRRRQSSTRRVKRAARRESSRGSARDGTRPGCGRRGQPTPPEIEFEPVIWPACGLRRAESPRDAIVGKQVTPGRRRATERFEANRRQSVQEPSPTASDRRCDDEPYFVDDVRCEQRLGDRDAGVDANVTAGRILEVLHELDQPAFDRCRIDPIRRGTGRGECRSIARCGGHRVRGRGWE